MLTRELVYALHCDGMCGEVLIFDLRDETSTIQREAERLGWVINGGHNCPLCQGKHIKEEWGQK